MSFCREIAKKIDVNKDGKINAQEIENWIEGNMKRYSLKNTNDRLKKWDTNNDEHVSWSEYIAMFSGNNLPKKERLKSDERRFDVRSFFLHKITAVQVKLKLCFEIMQPN